MALCLPFDEPVLETVSDEQIDLLITSQSDYVAWKKERYTYIGGSDAAATIGSSKYTSSYTLWCEKKEIIPPADENEFMRFGKDFEDVIARRFVEETGFELVRNIPLIRHPKYDYIGCNLDGIVLHEDGSRSGAEFKTYSDRTADLWGEPLSEEIPREYWIQCQHNLLVSELPEMYVYAFNRSDCLYSLYRVKAHEEFQATLLDKEIYWWNRFILGDVTPDPDESESTEKALKLRFPAGKEAHRITATEDIETDCKRLQQVKSEIAELEKTERHLCNIVRAFMEDATELTVSFSSKPITWRNDRSTEKVDHEQLAADYRAILERRRVLVPKSLDRLRFQRTITKRGARKLHIPKEK